MKTLIKISCLFALIMILSSIDSFSQTHYKNFEIDYGFTPGENVYCHFKTYVTGGSIRYSNFTDVGGLNQEFGANGLVYYGSSTNSGYVKCWCEISDKETVEKTYNFNQIPETVYFTFQTSDWHQKNELED